MSYNANMGYETTSSEQEGLVFAISRSECRAARLPGTREIGKTLLLHALLLSESAPSEMPNPVLLHRVNQQMRELIMSPIADLLAASRSLIVVPDGVLNRTSFAALVADGPVPAGADDARVLATDSLGTAVVQVVPSATIFAELRRANENNSSETLRACSVLALAGDLEAEGRPLAGARLEVRDLASKYRNVATALPWPRGSDSLNAAAAQAALGACDVLHIAAHAVVDAERPWRSMVQVGAPGDASARVDISAGDIAARKLSARLVTLSSCRSAGGRELSGEGVQGLAGAFLVAGVPAVVATLWPVDDGSTRHFMGRFYGHLASGAPVSLALAQAQADIRRDPGLQQPYYWAGFVVIGDGSATIRLERKAFWPPAILPLALILGGAWAVFGRGLAGHLSHRK